jgi:hypothetical protein
VLRSVQPSARKAVAPFAAVTLTPEAERHGLALALPEKVVVARPAGDGHALANIPIVGRHEVDMKSESA